MSNLCVVARVRPLFSDELGDAVEKCVTIRRNQLLLTDIKDARCNHVADNRKRRHTFTFDHIFGADEDGAEDKVQQEIYECLGQRAIASILDGYNSSIFAYGMTGTGKTYTIFGTKAAPGLLPRICNALLEHVQNNSSPETKCEQLISILEIYNEKVRDLLIDPCEMEDKVPLRVREHPDTGPYIEGLTQVPITSPATIDSIIARGIANRKTAENDVHQRSSRSHVICTIFYTEVKSDSGFSRQFTSKLSLIDLAGSEKTYKSNGGQRFEEGRYINLSLSSLSSVISRLAERSQRLAVDQDTTLNSSMSTMDSTRSSRQSALSTASPIHIPYRNSKLTWLLSDSLGGNALTTMIATISSSYSQYQETLKTLRYAQQAKLIVNQPKLNMDAGAMYIRQLLDEIAVLRRELTKRGPLQAGISGVHNRFRGLSWRRVNSEGDITPDRLSPMNLDRTCTTPLSNQLIVVSSGLRNTETGNTIKFNVTTIHAEESSHAAESTHDDDVNRSGHHDLKTNLSDVHIRYPNGCLRRPLEVYDAAVVDNRRHADEEVSDSSPSSHSPSCAVDHEEVLHNSPTEDRREVLSQTSPSGKVPQHNYPPVVVDKGLQVPDLLLTSSNHWPTQSRTVVNGRTRTRFRMNARIRIRPVSSSSCTPVWPGAATVSSSLFLKTDAHGQATSHVGALQTDGLSSVYYVGAQAVVSNGCSGVPRCSTPVTNAQCHINTHIPHIQSNHLGIKHQVSATNSDSLSVESNSDKRCCSSEVPTISSIQTNEAAVAADRETNSDASSSLVGSLPYSADPMDSLSEHSSLDETALVSFDSACDETPYPQLKGSPELDSPSSPSRLFQSPSLQLDDAERKLLSYFS
ncbi:unnamed protein product [Dicrocoelium dendriticum]|nr:unnamed protein product [Dicrocoelium dendriticum]